MSRKLFVINGWLLLFNPGNGEWDLPAEALGSVNREYMMEDTELSTKN